MNLNFNRRGLVILVYMFRFLLIFVKLSVQTWKIHNTNWDVLYKKDNLNIFILEPTKPLLFDKLHRLLGQPIYYRNTLYIVLTVLLKKILTKKTLPVIFDGYLAQWHPIKFSWDKNGKITQLGCVIFCHLARAKP